MQMQRQRRQGRQRRRRKGKNARWRDVKNAKNERSTLDWNESGSEQLYLKGVCCCVLTVAHFDVLEKTKTVPRECEVWIDGVGLVN